MNVKLTRAADEDLSEIWHYTFTTWGLDQADKYLDDQAAAFTDIGNGIARGKQVDGLPDDISVHRFGRHYILFLKEECPIILGVLHERMGFITRRQQPL